jgi:hypothetical protein
MSEFDPLDTGSARHLPSAGQVPDHPEDPATYGLLGNPKAKEGRLVRRRRKIIEEIERNRRGEYRVPTWLLVLILVVFVSAWALWIFLA